MDERKKMANVYILDILQSRTDDSLYVNGDSTKCLTQAQIEEILIRDYDLKVERKAISGVLYDFAESPYYHDKICYDTSSRKSRTKNGVENSETRTNFRYRHDFDAGQLRMLMDAILFSKTISASESKDLIAKIGKLSPVIRPVSHLGKLDEIKDIKPDNYLLVGNIDILNEALEKRHKIEFVYNDYGTDKKLHPVCSADGIAIVKKVSPYHMVANDGKFYLVACCDEQDSALNYRIDRITDLRITEEPAKPVKEVKGLNGGLKTVAEQMYMLPGNPEKVIFRASEHIINKVFDNFGNAVRFSDKKDGFVTCTVKVNPKAMRYWVMQYSDYVEILEPQRLREDVKNALLVAWRKYRDNGEEILLNDSEIDRIINGWTELVNGNHEKPDVQKLGEIVRKTHIAFLPFRCGSKNEMSLKYKELLLTLHQLMNNRFNVSSEHRQSEEYRAIELIIRSFVDSVESQPRKAYENNSDDVQIVVLFFGHRAKIDINNFEEDFDSLVETLRVDAGERRARYEEMRRKQRAENADGNHHAMAGEAYERMRDRQGKVLEETKRKARENK